MNDSHRLGEESGHGVDRFSLDLQRDVSWMIQCLICLMKPSTNDSVDGIVFIPCGCYTDVIFRLLLPFNCDFITVDGGLDARADTQLKCALAGYTTPANRECCTLTNDREVSYLKPCIRKVFLDDLDL